MSDSFAQSATTAIFPESSAERTFIEIKCSSPKRTSNRFGGGIKKLQKALEKEHQLSQIIGTYGSARDAGDQPHPVADHRIFRAVMTALTLLNMLQLGFEVDNPEWGGWLIVENTFTAAFVIEMAIKLFFLRRKYFDDKANWIDGSLAVLAALDCWILTPILGLGASADLQAWSILRVFRMVRLARLLRLVHRIRPLILVLQGVTQALATSFFVLVVCVMLIYVFAVFLTETLGKPDPNLYPGYSSDDEVIDGHEFMLNYNPHVYFGNMLVSMVTLFNMATFTEWPEVVRPIVLKQPLYLIVFLLFITISGFGLMNVLIGIIVDSVLAESKRVETEYQESLVEAKLMVLNEIQTMLFEIDLDQDGSIDLRELSEALHENAVLKKMVQELKLPVGWSPRELLEMLDRSGDGVLNHAEFTTNFFRLLTNNDFQKQCIMQSDINSLKALIHDQNKHLATAISDIQHDIAAIKSALEISESRDSPRAEEDSQRPRVETSVELLGLSAAQYFKVPDMDCHSGLISRMEKVVKECIQEGFAACTFNLMPELRCSKSQSRVLDSDHDDSKVAKTLKETESLPPTTLASGQMQRPVDSESKAVDWWSAGCACERRLPSHQEVAMGTYPSRETPGLSSMEGIDLVDALAAAKPAHQDGRLRL